MSYLLSPVAGATLLVAGANATGGAAILLIIIGALLCVAWLFPLLKNARHNKAGERYGRLLQRCLKGHGTLSGEAIQKIRTGGEDVALTAEDRGYQARAAYLQLLSAIVEDGRVTDEELERLRRAADVLALPADFDCSARVAAGRRFCELRPPGNPNSSIRLFALRPDCAACPRS